MTGRVLSQGGEPLVGAVVDVPGLRIGTLTDARGRFVLSLPPGLHRLRVRRLDHETVERTIEVTESHNGQLVFELPPRDLEAEPVLVTAKRIDESQRSPSAHYVMRSEAIENQIGSFDDIMRGVQSLPGVARPSDYHGEFFVRGAGSHANAVYFDGIPIFFPYHILGFNSVFNPGLVESAEFYAGGAPAAYGGGTGGVMLVRSRGASPTPYRADVGLSYIAGHIHAGGGNLQKGWVASARRSYHDKLARLIDGSSTTQIPSFYDAMLRVRWRPDERHLLLGGILVAGDGASIRDPEAIALRNDLIEVDEGVRLESTRDRLDLNNRLVVSSLYWRAVLGSKAFLETTVGYVPQRLRFSLRGENRESVDIDTRLLSVREDLTLHKSGHRMRFGWEGYRTVTEGLVSAYAAFVNLRQSNSSLNLNDQQERYRLDLGRTRWYGAVYALDDWSVWDDRLQLSPGVRYEHDGLTGQDLFSPRLALTYRPREHWQLYGSWGVHHTLRNTPMEVQPTPDGAPLRAERAVETTLGLSRSWDRGLSSGINAYYKGLSHLVFESEPAFFSNGARGRAHGLETWIEWKRPNAPFRAQAQYAWTSARQLDPSAWRRRLHVDSRTQEHVWGAVFEEPYWYRPMQDQPHRLALDARWRVRAWELGAHFELASGLPVTPVEDVAVDSEGAVYGVVGRKGSQRLPLYKRLDLRLLRQFSSARVDWRLYAEVLNVTAARNVYMQRWNRDYTSEYSVGMLPLLPTLGVEASF